MSPGATSIHLLNTPRDGDSTTGQPVSVPESKDCWGWCQSSSTYSGLNRGHHGCPRKRRKVIICPADPLLASPGTSLLKCAHQGPAQSCPKHLTSSIVHLATVAAVMPATPGSSLQCCSQHRDRERSGWAERADMKSDWCMLSEEIAGDKAQHMIWGREREQPMQVGRASGSPLSQQGVSVSKC